MRGGRAARGGAQGPRGGRRRTRRGAAAGAAGAAARGAGGGGGRPGARSWRRREGGRAGGAGEVGGARLGEKGSPLSFSPFFTPERWVSDLVDTRSSLIASGAAGREARRRGLRDDDAAALAVGRIHAGRWFPEGRMGTDGSGARTAGAGAGPARRARSVPSKHWHSGSSKGPIISHAITGAHEREGRQEGWNRVSFPCQAILMNAV